MKTANNTSKKRIVIVAREMFTSTGRYSERLVHYLQKIDTENEYLVLLKPADMHKWTPSNPNFKSIPCPYEEYTFSEQLGLKKQLDSLKPDLVHFTMEQQPILYRGRVVTTLHDLTNARTKNPSKNPVVFFIKQQVYKWLVKKVSRKSLQIITPTEYVKYDLAKFSGISTDKITVTLESADPIKEQAQPLPELDGKIFIMYVGRPSPHKNLARLISAFKILQQNNPQLRLVLAGKKDANYLIHEARVKRENIKNVIFTDFVSEGNLRWLYENTAAYCFPSLSEGFGLPGLEAMQHGAPVASSNATCLPEVYRDAATYFDPTNPDDIAKKIQLLLTDARLRETQVFKGYEHTKKFSWQRMAEQTLSVYKSTF